MVNDLDVLWTGYDASMAIGFAIGAVLMFLWSLWMDHRKK